MNDPRRRSAPAYTRETSYSEHWSPAVTHQVIQNDVHEVTEQRVHRETHKYHIRHQIQPVIEYEILPARHYVRTSEGEYTEVSEEEIPPGHPRGSWYTEEIASQLEKLAKQPVDPEKYQGDSQHGSSASHGSADFTLTPKHTQSYTRLFDTTTADGRMAELDGASGVVHRTTVSFVCEPK
jgi:hypothetical protein